jgi:hypothetical protein
MTRTIAFCYFDLGDAWWKTAVTEMIRSARRVMPGCKIVQLSDKSARQHPMTDEWRQGSMAATRETLSAVKAFMVTEYANENPGNVIFIDADVIWTAEPPLHTYGACGYDETANALPWRQFYIQSGVDKPGEHSREWLTNNVPAILDALPFCAAGNDAFELLLNLNIPKSHGAPAEIASADSTKFLVHFPGAENRQKMIDFARSMDGGEDFKRMEPGYDDRVFAEALNKRLTIPTEPELLQERHARPPGDGVNEDLNSINIG